VPAASSAYYLRAALDWIDALPKDLQLPAMPGFDRDAAELAAASSAMGDDGRAHADWLWVQLMDWCKQRRANPRDYNDLFAIVGSLRDRAASPSPSNEREDKR
jgi:hypothetical protein